MNRFSIFPTVEHIDPVIFIIYKWKMEQKKKERAKVVIKDEEKYKYLRVGWGRSGSCSLKTSVQS